MREGRKGEMEKGRRGRKQEREQNSSIFFKILFLNSYLSMSMKATQSYLKMISMVEL